MNTVEIVYSYNGLHGSKSKCGLRVTSLRDGRVLVICSELPDNPGTSVTNFAEELASLVCGDYQIDPSRLVWIEHYPASKYHRSADWDLVTFRVVLSDGRKVVLDEPQWRPMREEDWRDIGMTPPRTVTVREEGTHLT